MENKNFNANNKVKILCVFFHMDGVICDGIFFFFSVKYINPSSFKGRFGRSSHLWWDVRRHCVMGNRLCSSELSRRLHKSEKLQPLDRLDHQLWQLKYRFNSMWEGFASIWIQKKMSFDNKSYFKYWCFHMVASSVPIIIHLRVFWTHGLKALLTLLTLTICITDLLSYVQAYFTHISIRLSQECLKFVLKINVNCANMNFFRKLYSI